MARGEDAISMGKDGVDLVSSPIHTAQGSYLQAQNATFSTDENQGGIKKRWGMSPLNAEELDGPVLAATAIPLRSAIDVIVPVPGMILGTGSGFLISSDGATFTPLNAPAPGLGTRTVVVDDLTYYLSEDEGTGLWSLVSFDPVSGTAIPLVTLESGAVPVDITSADGKVYVAVQTSAGADVVDWAGPVSVGTVPVNKPSTTATGRVVEWDPSLGVSATISKAFGDGGDDVSVVTGLWSIFTDGGEYTPPTPRSDYGPGLFGAVPTALYELGGWLVAAIASWLDSNNSSTQSVPTVIDTPSSGFGDLRVIAANPAAPTDPWTPGTDFDGVGIWPTAAEASLGGGRAPTEGAREYDVIPYSDPVPGTYVTNNVGATIVSVTAFDSALFYAGMQRAGTNAQAPFDAPGTGGRSGGTWSSGDRAAIGKDSFVTPLTGGSSNATGRIISPDANPGRAFFRHFIEFDSKLFVGYGSNDQADGEGDAVDGKVYVLDAAANPWVEDIDVIGVHGGSVHPGQPYEFGGDLYWPWYGTPGTTNAGYILKRDTAGVWTVADSGLDLRGPAFPASLA